MPEQGVIKSIGLGVFVGAVPKNYQQSAISMYLRFNEEHRGIRQQLYDSCILNVIQNRSVSEILLHH